MEEKGLGEELLNWKSDPLTYIIFLRKKSPCRDEHRQKVPAMPGNGTLTLVSSTIHGTPKPK